MQKHISLFVVFWLCQTLLWATDPPYKSKTVADNNPLINRTDVMERDEQVPLSDKPIDLEKYYKIDYIKEFYEKRIKAPALDLTAALEGKSAHELRLMRYDVFARKGYLFQDAILRAHFNQFKWYQPIYDVEDFKVYLTDAEKAYIRRIADAENKLHTADYSQKNGLQLANFDNLQNLQQFLVIPDALKSHVVNDGFALVPTKEKDEQLFYTYDRNHYDYIPSFVTTDLYLQVLHIHLSKQIQLLEEVALINRLTFVMKGLYGKAKESVAKENNPIIKKAAEWNMAYTSLALWLLTNETNAVPASMQGIYEAERSKISAKSGGFVPSPLTGEQQMDYSQIQPRGNYTRTDTLRRYFQAVKWLAVSPFLFEDMPGTTGLEPAKTLQFLMLAHFVKSDPNILADYKAYAQTVRFLAGEEDNLSLSHAMEAIGTRSLNDLANAKTQASVLRMLVSLDPERIKGKGTNPVSDALLQAKKAFFLPGRYTFDAEIMQRLIHVMGAEPKRPFPKGLDIFATFGNTEAENILKNVYQEQKNWPQFPDTLKTLQKQFKNFSAWDANVYSQFMNMVIGLQATPENAPFYMKNPAWAHKNLNTMLAGWTQLKHDMLLYVKQPFAAQAGQGGGPPPPRHIAYVEPNIAFWKNALALLERNEKMLKDLGVSSEKLDNRQKSLRSMAEFLLACSQKQLSGIALSPNDHERLTWIGGEVESLTLDILESMDFYSIQSPDKSIAIAADVYTYKGFCLEEGIGHPDEIYVVVDIDGFLYMARGAVLSHYEFKQPTEERLTDEKWQEMLKNNQVPERAEWYKPHVLNIEPLKSKPSYSF